MPCAAVWHSGMEEPRVISGALTPGVPQRWVVSLVAEGYDGGTMRLTLKPRAKCRISEISQLVDEEVAQFRKESGGLKSVSWTATCR